MYTTTPVALLNDLAAQLTVQVGSRIARVDGVHVQIRVGPGVLGRDMLSEPHVCLERVYRRGSERAFRRGARTAGSNFCRRPRPLGVPEYDKGTEDGAEDLIAPAGG